MAIGNAYLSDGYEEDLSSLDNDAISMSSLFSNLEPTSSNCLKSQSLVNDFLPTELDLMDLKSTCRLSTLTMNKIIKFCKGAKLDDLSISYEDLEGKMISKQSLIEAKEVQGCKSLPFIPLHKWLSVLIQQNLMMFLVTTPSAALLVGDLSTGTWFEKFISRCPPNRIPVAFDIYYDHWQVSDSTKIGGLYMTIANSSPQFLMKPDNKFVLCLVLDGACIQLVLFDVLHEFISHKGLFEVVVDNIPFLLYLEICHLVGDIPGLAELCCVLNHRANLPCHRCTVLSADLLKFDTLPSKLQSETLHILSTYMPNLEVHGKVGKAREKIRSYGLKAKLPIWLQLPTAMGFDQTIHSVTCLLHNEELGIMLQEITLFISVLSPPQLNALVEGMLGMPSVSGLPRFK